MEQPLINLLYEVVNDDHRSGLEAEGYYSSWVIVHITDEGAIDTGPGADLDHTWLVGQTIEHHVPHGEHEHATPAREYLQTAWEDFVDRDSSWPEGGPVTCDNPEMLAVWKAAGFDWDAEVARLREMPPV